MNRWYGRGSMFRNFLTSEKGVGAIEYGLLAAGIAVAIIATVAALGTSLDQHPAVPDDPH